MSEIARIGKSALPAYFDQDKGMSSNLWWAIDRTSNPHRDVGAPREFHAAVQHEARRALEDIGPFCIAAGPDLVTLWATPLMAGLSKDTAPDAAVARMRLVVIALQNLAAGAFTLQAQAQIAQTAHYTPMPADLYDALAPRSVELRQRQSALRHIVEAATIPPVRAVES